MIDPNEGEKYPPVLLQNYKALHEANIARQKGGVFSPVGWFQKVTIHESPIFQSETTLRFGKVTLLSGRNDTGKTALCEWLAGVGDPSLLSLWATPTDTIQLDLEVFYSDPVDQRARLKIGGDGRIRNYFNKEECPFYPSPLRFVTVREPGRLLWRRKTSELDDLQLLCSELNIDPLTVRNLFPYVDKFGSGSVRNLRAEEVDGVLRVVADLEGTKPGLSYRVMSHSEQTRILTEIAIVMARFSAEHVPTMLLIEGLWRFNTTWVQRFCDFLSEANRGFQTIIVMSGEWDIARLHWAGWVAARLERMGTQSVINQDLF